MTDTPDIATRITLVEERVDVHEHRITQHGREIDELKEANLRTTSEVGYLSKQLQSINKTIDSIDVKVDGILKRPGARWDSMVSAVVNAIALAMVAYALSKIGM